MSKMSGAIGNLMGPGGLSARLDRVFAITDRGSSVPREIRAGFVTFASMAYIVAVNPSILANAGMDRADLVSATVLAAVFGSLMMGLAANLPLAVAPAMGANVIFTYVIVRQSGLPWPAGLALVAATGVIFLALGLTRYRALIARDFPDTLKLGIQAAVGMLLVFYGLRASGLIVQPAPDVLTVGRYDSPPVLLAAFGLLLTQVLTARRVPGAVILSIAILTVMGLLVPAAPGRMVTSIPDGILAWPHWPHDTFLRLDVGTVFHDLSKAVPILVYIVCAEFFTTIGALGVVAKGAEPARPDGAMPGTAAAFATDATASIVGPMLGTSVVTAYMESAAGVAAGGRTGLTAVTVAALFLIFLFLWPVIVIVPLQASSPSLVLVGIVMLQGIARVDMGDLSIAVPIALTLLVTVVTYSLIDGLALGTFVHLVNEIALGRRSKITWTTWVFAMLVAAYIAFTLHVVARSDVEIRGEARSLSDGAPPDPRSLGEGPRLGMLS